MTEYMIGEIIFTQEQIEERAAEIGREITEDYKGETVLVVGILTGSVMWMAEVMKSIDLDLAIDFMSVSSYGAATESSGIVKINKDLKSDIKGRHVILVEDIVDSGKTLDVICRFLKTREPASLKICTMLDKKERRKVDMEADYVGFSAPDLFLIGFGLDIDQRYRNLPYVAAAVKEG